MSYSNGSSSSSLPPRGVPILSGKPPVVESDSCRICDKFFIPLFRKPHLCHHCGYQYCDSDCSESALLPRLPSSSSSSSNQSNNLLTDLFPPSNQSAPPGYDLVTVCKQCLPNLQITAAAPSALRAMPLKRLQAYTKAYNLGTENALEKEDFVQSIVKARGGQGALSAESESYYRRRSVPRHGILPKPPTPTPTRATPTQPLPTRPTAPRPTPPRSTPAAPQPRPAQSRPYHPPPVRPAPQARPPAAAARPPAAKPTPVQKRPPSPPVPTIRSLLALPKSYLGELSIGTLKAILHENHVKVDFAQVLEKAELVNRVSDLCKEERKRLERQARDEAAEEALLSGISPSSLPRASADGGEDDLSLPIPTGPQGSVERDGLCVVCQENEAQLAVVDCGHLSMCQECAGLVLETSRECPMCRTRIVTDQRLIRIFRA